MFNGCGPRLLHNVCPLVYALYWPPLSNCLAKLVEPTDLALEIAIVARSSTRRACRHRRGIAYPLRVRERPCVS